MKLRGAPVLAAVAMFSVAGVEAAEPVQADVVVYGGTPAGVMAAIAAARHGRRVALVDINKHVGGVVSGGLCSTDMGDRKTVGGLANDFFLRIVKFYREKYGPDSKQFKACRNGHIFEPHVAERIFEEMLREQPSITLSRGERFRSAIIEGTRVAELATEDASGSPAKTYRGAVYIDASYEGDLMAAAHVPYRVGRESRAEYGEYLAGVSMGAKEARGLGDHRTMAYNYRGAVTLDTANRVLFPKPENYDPAPFRDTDGKRIIAGLATGFGSFFTTVEKVGPNGKFDANWGDFPGNSEGYAEGSWATRDRIAGRVKDFYLSRLYYFQNDPELPEAFRTEARTWGLPSDEFADNGHFPFQLYVREARRMVGQHVLREQDLTQDRWKPDGIATGGYGIDCHVVQRVYERGRLVPEHTRHVAVNNYDIPYRSLVPPDVENLLVPVCCSATHVAYCSLRMEPVYMMLGQAAGTAAHLALAGPVTVQKVNAGKLRELLIAQGAVLDAGYQPQARISVTPPHPRPGERAILKVIPGPGLKSPLVQYSWDCEGMGRLDGTGERYVHTFALEKTYGVSALVTDEAGRRRLLTAEVPVGRAIARDVTLDDFDAETFGRWDGTLPEYLPGLPLRYSDVFLGPGIHRDVTRKGKKAPARVRFQPDLARSGRYQVCLGFRPARHQATNVPVTIRHATGTAKLIADQRTEKTPFNFTALGEFAFKAGDGGFVEISNGDTNGRVVVDGVRWVWLGE
jgi:hypothetical protein